MSDLAAALDIVGPRWALLIVERLLEGPQRYGDLQRELGLGTNMLTIRLRELETAGVLYRLPLHHNTRAYALTERGLALRLPILALGRWAADHRRTATAHDLDQAPPPPSPPPSTAPTELRPH